MNAKKKGDRAENEVYKIFESWGYIVNKAPRTMKRIFTKKGPMYVSQRNDHWGLFDGEARNGINHVLFQVKSQATHVSAAKPAIEKFRGMYGSEHEMFQIWLRVPRKGFIVYVFVGEGFNKKGLWLKHYINIKGEAVPPFTLKGEDK